MPDTLGYVAEIETEKFDYSGPIPEDANAGNRFYGGDFAAYLSETVKRSG